MLSRANRAYEANQPSRNDLAKQLFPSSSPGGKVQDGNIIDSFKKSTQAKATTSASARNPASTITASPGMSSITGFVGRQHSTKPANSMVSSGVRQSASMASLYNESDPFKDDPDDLLYRPANTEPSAPHVFFNEDDFSDDDNLDLDLEHPTSLPPLPKAPAAANPAPLRESTNPPGPPSTQPIPWTSSPASHMLPPTSRSVSSRTLSDVDIKKRPSEGESCALRAHPPKKTRTIPWKTEESFEEQENEPEVSMWAAGAVTPASKKKDQPLWDASASTVKAHRKQLKNQSKKPAATNDPTSMEEIQEIVAKQTAAKGGAAQGIKLSEEQQRVQDLVVKSGQSVFFTGPAGTGKSVLMRSIIAELKKKFARDPERLAVTASTGLAACNIGGITLHSFSGIGLGKEEVPMLVKKIRRNPKAKNRWLKTKVLIIDEVSMVDGDLFDKLSQIGRTIRNNGRPWGGIQLVITGDFFQLPPVPDTSEGKREAKFAFDAATWNTSIDHTIGLTQVFRQKDPVFANMLNEMRLGRISDETVAAFKKLSRPIPASDLDLDTTELFPTRTEVEASNQSRLRSLPGKSYRYDSHDTGDVAIRDKLLQNMMAPKSLELKVGAQVMLVKNMDDTLVNGSLGKVKAFRSEAVFEMQNQGFGSDDRDGLDPKVRSRMQSLTKEYEESKRGAAEYPVVEFAATDGTHRTILCVPEDWKVELPTGEVQASRSQVPLILAWALSIHKAQGQTLERVKVDLGKVFEKGQAYVALSRATRQEGLQVLRFEKHKVMAHPRVVHFYNKLYSVEEAESKKAAGSLSSFVYPKARNQPPPTRRSNSKKQTREAIEIDDGEEAMAEAYGY